MDNSRKNDSIATKTHPQKTAVNQQQTSVYDQNQQPGEMLAGHGMAATGAVITVLEFLGVTGEIQ